MQNCLLILSIFLILDLDFITQVTLMYAQLYTHLYNYIIVLVAVGAKLSQHNKAPSTRTRVNLKPGKYFHGYAYRPHVTG